VRIPEGRVELGAQRGSLPFGWDNEFPAWEVNVPSFTVDATPVRNADFLDFVKEGGYEERGLWPEEAWNWMRRRDHRMPAFWSATPDGWTCRTLFADVPLEQAMDWPVYTTWAEACAFARFLGRRLPTEAEFHRAAYTTSTGGRRLHPWGDAEPRAELANVGCRSWAPRPAGASPRGASDWGVLDLVGNGWDWTSSAFAPFPGFEPMPTYPGYSADFFDGRHFVLLGGSFATDDALLRPSFRNWYQPLYPYVFAQFRCVSAD
jgi:formylglycine-generating enzyme required for sulfatase activity